MMELLFLSVGVAIRMMKNAQWTLRHKQIVRKRLANLHIEVAVQILETRKSPHKMLRRREYRYDQYVKDFLHLLQMKVSEPSLLEPQNRVLKKPMIGL